MLGDGDALQGELRRDVQFLDVLGLGVGRDDEGVALDHQLALVVARVLHGQVGDLVALLCKLRVGGDYHGLAHGGQRFAQHHVVLGGFPVEVALGDEADVLGGIGHAQLKLRPGGQLAGDLALIEPGLRVQGQLEGLPLRLPGDAWDVVVHRHPGHAVARLRGDGHLHGVADLDRGRLYGGRAVDRLLLALDLVQVLGEHRVHGDLPPLGDLAGHGVHVPAVGVLA